MPSSSRRRGGLRYRLARRAAGHEDDADDGRHHTGQLATPPPDDGLLLPHLVNAFMRFDTREPFTYFQPPLHSRRRAGDMGAMPARHFLTWADLRAPDKILSTLDYADKSAGRRLPRRHTFRTRCRR